MSLFPDFQRVKRGSPCPICGKPDWCLIGSPGSNGPYTAICQRIESPHRWGDAGYLHRLEGNRGGEQSRDDIRGFSAPSPLGQDFDSYSRKCIGQLSASNLRRLATDLRVSRESLQRLHVGWDDQAWTLPMQNRRGQVVGIRRRLENGRKLSVKGGRDGLFIPQGVNPAAQLLVCEGPTDTAALLDLGLQAIGRPSCTGGTKHLVRFIRAERPESVVVVADQGLPGQRGAERLALACRAVCKAVRVITPPGKLGDARAWVIAGATRTDFQQLAELASPIGLQVKSARRVV